MSKAAMNLQDSFLNQVRRENSEVNILLVNGKSLRGTVKGFDNFTVIINSRNGQHLIYKHAIAQLLSHRNVQIKREGEESGGREAHAEKNSAAASVSTEQAEQQQPQQQENRSKHKKGGFNTLDLSSVKLEDSEEVKVPSE